MPIRFARLTRFGSETVPFRGPTAALRGVSGWTGGKGVSLEGGPWRHGKRTGSQKNTRGRGDTREFPGRNRVAGQICSQICGQIWPVRAARIGRITSVLSDPTGINLVANRRPGNLRLAVRSGFPDRKRREPLEPLIDRPDTALRCRYEAGPKPRVPQESGITRSVSPGRVRGNNQTAAPWQPPHRQP